MSNESPVRRRLPLAALTGMILTWAAAPALAQQGSYCQQSPPIGAEACAKWVCVQRARCKVPGPGRREQITTCPPACTPGQSEWVTVYDDVWSYGCVKLACVAKKLPDCPTGARRIAGKCVFMQGRDHAAGNR